MKFSAPHPKFNNKKVETPDGVFDSKGEWQRWLFLKDAERRGLIRNLRRQVKYILIPTQYRTEIVHLKTKDKEVQRVAEREVTYTADFVYYKVHDAGAVNGEYEISWDIGEVVVEDFKGLRTKDYLIKRKLMLYLFGIPIKEVARPTNKI